MTAAELSQQLGVSLAAISAAVRFLAPAGIIVRERPAGQRQDRFKVDADVWLNIMRQRDVELAKWEEQIRGGPPGAPLTRLGAGLLVAGICSGAG